ncbi:hypothetical protein pb186bvf_004310 [Paramecium bursaria]
MDSNDLFKKCQVELIQQLGEGSFGKVFKAFDKIHRKVAAVKLLNLQENETEHQIMQKLNHKNIVKHYRQGENSAQILLIMEYMEGGSLDQYVENNDVTEAYCREIMKDIFNGLSYLHQFNIIHRDLKMENILLSKEGVAKIADFGLSIIFEGTNFPVTRCGTLIYMSPEQLLNQQYSKPIDVWACGIIMYRLLNKGRHPFWTKDMDKNEYFQKVFDGRFNQKGLSSNAIDLLQRLLKINVQDRYTAFQALRHPFITGSDLIPLSLQEQINLIDYKIKFNQIVNCLMFLKHLQKPKVSYGYMIGQKGFNVRQVRLSSDTKINQKYSFNEQPTFQVKQNDIADTSPDSLKTYYAKNQQLEKLSLYYAQITQKQKSETVSPVNQLKPLKRQKTLTFSQASREYANLMLEQSIQQQRKKSVLVKLQPIENKRRTNSMMMQKN